MTDIATAAPARRRIAARTAALDRAYGPFVALLAGLVALVMLIGAAGPALAAGSGGGSGAGAAPGQLVAPALRYEMPTLYVMLAPEDGRLPMRLRLGLTLELAEPETAGLLEQTQPLINDGVWQMLTRLPPSQVAGPGGMDQLRGELLRIIGAAVGYGKVTDIYFREFFTQQPI